VKRILFISPRNPFLGRYSGDVIRANRFAFFFREKYQTTVLTNDKFNSRKKIGKLKLITFKSESFIFKFINIIFSFIQLKPFQLGYFYSYEIDNFVKKNYKNFDIIFCQSIRVAPYIINLKFKKKILDMGDLYSNNYFQTFKTKSIFNPVKIIYFLESLLIKKYENYCLKKFHKILLFSKKEIKTLKINKQKIVQINFGVNKISKKFSYSKKNNKIIFIGNIKYLPNKIACNNFINNIFPKILKIDPSIQFHIIGEISKFNELMWKRNIAVKIHGKVNNLEPLLSKAFCGLAHLNISSGIQTKLLTYMSYGIPSVSSKQVIDNFDAIKSSHIPVYKNENELIKLIFKLKNDKNFSQSVSKRSLSIIKKFKWEKVLKDLNKI
jgi:hypothetical protein